MTDGNEHVTVATAADLAGVPARTLRYWVETGKLPAIAGKHGRLVRLGDVREIASLTGKDGNLGNSFAAVAAGKVTATADLAGNLAAKVAEGSRALAQERGGAATLMQEMVRQVVAPLAEANERQAVELTRLHDLARQQAEELGVLRERLAHAERAQDAPASPVAPEPIPMPTARPAPSWRTRALRWLRS